MMNKIPAPPAAKTRFTLPVSKKLLPVTALTHSLIHHFVTIQKFKEAADDNWNVANKDFKA